MVGERENRYLVEIAEDNACGGFDSRIDGLHVLDCFDGVFAQIGGGLLFRLLCTAVDFKQQLSAALGGVDAGGDEIEGNRVHSGFSDNPCVDEAVTGNFLFELLDAVGVVFQGGKAAEELLIAGRAVVVRGDEAAVLLEDIDKILSFGDLRRVRVGEPMVAVATEPQAVFFRNGSAVERRDGGQDIFVEE